MIEIWILILFAGGDGRSIAMHEFNTLATCQTAGNTFVDDQGWGAYRRFYCVKK